MNRTWVQRRDAERRGAAPGQAGFCGVARGPGCPKLWSPGAGTHVGARAWVGGIPVLQITRIIPKEKRDSSQIGVLGTSVPAHSGASWHLRAPPRGRKCLSPVRWPQWSRWELRALVKWQSCESALGGHGKELGRQRPSAPRTWQEHPSSGLSTGSRWLGGQLFGSLVSASQTLPPSPGVVSAWPLAEPNCFWWRVTHMRPQQLAIPRPASTFLAVMDPWAPRASASPQPYQLPWSLQNHPTFLETGQQKSRERGSSEGKQWNNREACLQTHYPEPDCPRTSHRAGSRTPLILCIFILLTLKNGGRKKNAA